MNTRNMIMLACATGFVMSPAARAEKQEPAKQPNLLYIFPDQYRMYALSIWSDPAYSHLLSTVGDPVHTPNLDRLAKEGVLFTQACSTSPVSSPHRAMLMSGMFPSQNGVITNCHVGREEGLKPEIECLTDVIAKAGYETAYIGKTHWHKTEALFDKDKNYVGTTEAPGGKVVNNFDTYIPAGKSRHSNKFWFQGIKSHYISYTYSNQPELVDGKKDGEVKIHKGFTAAHEADIVIKYLENRNGERIAGKPFSIIWAINPPHPPYEHVEDCDPDIYNRYYKDLTAEELFLRENAEGIFTDEKGKKRDFTTFAKVYFSLIQSVDAEIGRVLEALDKTGEADHTIVVFTSDHGEMMGSQNLLSKNKIYEESFLVPYIIRYPEKIRPHVEDLSFGSTDIMPTLLGLMGLEDRIPASVMGKDYSDGIVTGKFVKNPKPVSSVFLSDASKGVRTARYSYVVFSDGNYELYDNQEDPYQKHNLRLEDIPAKEVDFIQSELGKWLITAKDQWAEKKTNPDLVKYGTIKKKLKSARK